MNLTEIVEAVIEHSGRPDQEAFITRKVRAAIRQVHAAGMFPRDLVEELVELQEPTNLIKLTLPPRFRKFKALMPAQSTGNMLRTVNPRNDYLCVDPTDIVTMAYQSRQDVYYVAGAVVNIRSSSKPDAVYMLYYNYPEVADPYLETWAMAAQPELFIDAALVAVLGFFGNTTKSRELQQQFVQNLEYFVMDNLVEGET